MNDLIRPAMYDAFHEVVAVCCEASDPSLKSADTQRVTYDVVGPICETGDTFARDRELVLMKAGDLVVFTGAGAYGAVMSSEYNSRPLVPEVLVDGSRKAVIRPRPTYEDMLAREPLADWLRP
jgi:diaminopimelate decarboxylase